MEEVTPTMIYWIMQADSMRTALTVMTGLFLIITFGWTFIGSLATADDAISYRSFFIVLSILSIITLAFTGARVFAPSTKTLLTMYAVPAAIEVAKDNNIDKTAQKALKALDKVLDEYVEEKK